MINWKFNNLSSGQHLTEIIYSMCFSSSNTGLPSDVTTSAGMPSEIPGGWRAMCGPWEKWVCSEVEKVKRWLLCVSTTYPIVCTALLLFCGSLFLSGGEKKKSFNVSILLFYSNYFFKHYTSKTSIFFLLFMTFLN